MARGDNLGDKLLPKIVHAVSQTMISTKRAMLPWDHWVRYKATQDIIDKLGHEIADHYGPIADLLLAADDGSLHPVARQFLQDSRSGHDQAKAISGLLMGSAQSAIGTFLSNELAPLVYTLVRSNPHLDLDPQTAAQSAATRTSSIGDALGAMADQGFSNNVGQTLIEMAYAYPGLADALDMSRRGVISDNELTLIMERNAVPPGLIGAWRALSNVPLSLADAALAYLRSDISLAQAQKIAHDNGFTDEQLTVFIGNTGEPLGLEQLLEAYRRGFIDEPTLERGIKQSRTRNEWIATAVKLRYSPMSVADAVNAVVQNHMSQADAQTISNQNGLEPSAFPVLVETAGEPLSRTEMQELFNRGLVTSADVAQALRESRLKNKYVDDALQLHIRLLEPRQLGTAVESGALSHAEAVKKAMESGLSTQDATIIVDEASARKLATYRGRVVASAETMYEDSAIGDSELNAIAQANGFDASEADYIVKAAAYRKQSRIIAAGISAIRSKFIGHHISKSEASSLLDAFGIPAEQRDFQIAAWEVELSANTRELTEAQIAKAVKLQLISPQDGLTRLVNLGYNEGDAKLLLEGA